MMFTRYMPFMTLDFYQSGRATAFLEAHGLKGNLNKNSHVDRVFNMVPGKMVNST